MRETYNQMSERIFRELKKKEEDQSKLFNEICSDNNLGPIYDFLRKNKNHSRLKISPHTIKSGLKQTLKYIVEDLKDYSTLLQTSHEPFHVRRHIKSIKDKLEEIEEIIKVDPLLIPIINSILNEGDFESKEESVRLSPKEAKKLLNSEIKNTETIGLLRENSKLIIEAINLALPKLSEQTIWAFRLYHLRPEKQALFYASYSMKNKYLFILTYHLDHFVENLGIKSHSGKIDFISKLIPLISSRIVYENMGDLNSTRSNIDGLYRTKTWESLHRFK